MSNFFKLKKVLKFFIFSLVFLKSLVFEKAGNPAGVGQQKVTVIKIIFLNSIIIVFAHVLAPLVSLDHAMCKIIVKN